MKLILERWNHWLSEERAQLDELTSRSRNYVYRYMKDGTDIKDIPKYSFSSLFENPDDMRIAISMEDKVGEAGTKLFKRIVKDLGWVPYFKDKKVKQKRRREGGEEYVEEILILDPQMRKTETRVIPKGPREGEVIKREVNTSLGKIIRKEGTDEEKAWWKENHNALREIRNVMQWFVRPYQHDFAEDYKADKPIIIVSRHPIDVARMSDFSRTHSCHSEGRDQFECAIMESKGHGMVAFLVDKKDWEKFELEKNLQKDEIFLDPDVGLGGPEPIGRVRIRKLFNRDTKEEFGVVEEQTYGATTPDFLPTIKKWLRDNQTSIWLNKDGRLNAEVFENGNWIFLGGEYFDTDLEEQLRNLFTETEWEAEADLLNISIEHGDPYDEEEEIKSEYEEAEEKLSVIQEEADSESVHVSITTDIENEPLDTGYVVSCNMNVQFSFSIPDGWIDNKNAKYVPRLSGAKETMEIEDIFRDEIIAPENFESDFYQVRNNTIIISISSYFQSYRVEDVEREIEYIYIEEVDNNYDELEEAFYQWLMREGYLPPDELEEDVKSPNEARLVSKKKRRFSWRFKR